MKLIAILLALIFTLTASAVAPYGIKGQNQAGTLYSNVHQFPNNQVTNLGGINALVETGNKNILSNPSFEHSNYENSWNTSTFATDNSTRNESTTVIISGKKSSSHDAVGSKTVAITQSSTLYASNFAGGVQGIVMVWVKTNVPLDVCAVHDGVLSTVDCVTTSTDNIWSLYEVPTILTGTSNGISIQSNGTVDGRAYIDDAFVGAVDLKQDVNNIGSWTSYTPTFTGLGTVSTSNIKWRQVDTDPTFTGLGTVSTSNIKWRQVGSNIEIAGTFVSGTVSGTEARLSLPNSYTTPSTLPAVSAIGSWFKSGSSDNKGGPTLIEPSVAYITFSGRETYGAGAVTPLTKATGSGMSSSSETVSVYASVPISQLSGATSIYSASCGANCVDTFSAKVSSTGVVSGENIDWINGNTVVSGTSLYTFTWNTGLFTVAPNCTMTADNANGFSADAVMTHHTPTTSSGGVVRVLVGGSTIAQPFIIICQKQGADFVATRTIAGTFKEADVSPGVNKPKTCDFAYGGTSSTLAAPVEHTSGSPVEVIDTCLAGTGPAWNGTGTYTDFTIANGTFANSSYIECECKAWDVTNGTIRVCKPYFATSDNTWSTTASGGYIGNYTVTNESATFTDAFYQITCKGQAP